MQMNFIWAEDCFNGIKGLSLTEETLDCFVLVDAKMHGGVFSQVNKTSCILGPILTSHFKTFYGFLEYKL